MPDIIFHTTPQGNVNIKVVFEDETFWLTQKERLTGKTGEGVRTTPNKPKKKA